MDIILYILIFVIGILFGSFYTLAIYRIPKTQDILHTRSYCPNCGHKLNFWDLIPLFSYIFLGGKCHYCKEKIRPRYFIIELISGLFFVLIAYLIDFSIQNLTTSKIIEFSFLILYFTFVIIMAGIDKENRQIQKGISAYGIIVSIIYMVYLYILDNTNIYRYGIYLVFYAIYLILDNITLRKYAKNRYLYGIMYTIITMAIFTGAYVFLQTIIATLLTITIYILLKKLKNKKSHKTESITQKIPIGFLLGVSNIAFMLFDLAYNKYLFFA